MTYYHDSNSIGLYNKKNWNWNFKVKDSSYWLNFIWFGFGFQFEPTWLHHLSLLLYVEGTQLFRIHQWRRVTNKVGGGQNCLKGGPWGKILKKTGGPMDPWTERGARAPPCPPTLRHWNTQHFLFQFIRKTSLIKLWKSEFRSLQTLSWVLWFKTLSPTIRARSMI